MRVLWQRVPNSLPGLHQRERVADLSYRHTQKLARSLLYSPSCRLWRFSETQRAIKEPGLLETPAFAFSAKCCGYLPSEAHLSNISPAFSMEVTGWASTLQVS